MRRSLSADSAMNVRAVSVVGSDWTAATDRRCSVRVAWTVRPAQAVGRRLVQWLVTAQARKRSVTAWRHSSRCSIPFFETLASVMSPGIQFGLSSGASSSQAQPS